MKRVSWRVVVGVLAVIGLGFGLLLGYTPGLVPAGVRGPLESLVGAVDRRTAMLAAGAAIALVGVIASWLWRSDGRAGDWAGTDAESAHRDVRVSGADLTDAIQEARADGPALEAGDQDPLKRRLRAVLADRDPNATGGDDESSPIETGAWTDDRVAAAFLTTADTIDYPLSHRLYAWLYPQRAYDRRVRRALREVEAVCATALARYEPPEHDRSRLAVFESIREGTTGGEQE